MHHPSVPVNDDDDEGCTTVHKSLDLFCGCQDGACVCFESIFCILLIFAPTLGLPLAHKLEQCHGTAV